jgi:hypothetical protein
MQHPPAFAIPHTVRYATSSVIPSHEISTVGKCSKESKRQFNEATADAAPNRLSLQGGTDSPEP